MIFPLNPQPSNPSKPIQIMDMWLPLIFIHQVVWKSLLPEFQLNYNLVETLVKIINLDSHIQTPWGRCCACQGLRDWRLLLNRTWRTKGPSYPRSETLWRIFWRKMRSASCGHQFQSFFANGTVVTESLFGFFHGNHRKPCDSTVLWYWLAGPCGSDLVVQNKSVRLAPISSHMTPRWTVWHLQRLMQRLWFLNIKRRKTERFDRSIFETHAVMKFGWNGAFASHVCQGTLHRLLLCCDEIWYMTYRSHVLVILYFHFFWLIWKLSLHIWFKNHQLSVYMLWFSRGSTTGSISVCPVFHTVQHRLPVPNSAPSALTILS